MQCRKRRANTVGVGIRPLERERTTFIGLYRMYHATVRAVKPHAGAFWRIPQHQRLAIRRDFRLLCDEICLINPQEICDAPYLIIAHAAYPIRYTAARPASTANKSCKRTFHVTFHCSGRIAP